jgi:hypothetical protein
MFADFPSTDLFLKSATVLSKILFFSVQDETPTHTILELQRVGSSSLAPGRTLAPRTSQSAFSQDTQHNGFCRFVNLKIPEFNDAELPHIKS